MGTEKYPTENDYDDYLHQNGGYCNAYTDLDHTAFMFNVKASALRGALDRFAQFFITPLCLEDAMDREVMAVDSEFSISRQNDGWRYFRILQQTAKPGNVYKRFTMGNRKSLKEDPEKDGLNIRKKLLEFYKSHYSAERMCLAVLGGETLPELESWIHELFSSIPSGLGPMPSFQDQSFPFQGQFLYLMASVKQLRQTTISFQLPSLRKEYREKSEHYISHVLGHEGAGSLLSELKQRGWATELSAGVEHATFTANSFVYLFQITITLTEAGLKESPGFGLAPVALVFKYLDLMRSSPPKEWIYEEMKSIHQIKLRFLEEEDPDDYVTKLAASMLHIQEGDEVVCDYIFDGLDSEKVAQLLALMHPKADGLRVDLQVTDYDVLVEQLQQNNGRFESVEDSFEAWYEIPYKKCKLSDFHFNFFAEFPSSEKLSLPEKNPYIPSSFKVLCEENGHLTTEGSQVKPDLLLDINGLRIWHKIDTLHKTPKTQASFLLSGPSCADMNQSLWKATPKEAAAHQLLIDIFDDVMNEECYMAELANLDFRISLEYTGMVFNFDGFSEKLPLLVNKVFQTLASLEVKSNLLKFDIKDHLALILKELHVEALIYGNLKSSEALELCQGIRKELGKGHLKAASRRLLQCVKLQSNGHLVKIPTLNLQEKNSGVQAYFQFGINEIHSRCKLDLIGQISEEPCFDQLRNQEQLGYIVYSCVRRTHGVLGFSILVISERFSPTYVNKRIEAFIEQLLKTIVDMKEEDFETRKAALIEEKMQKDKNIGETSLDLWNRIISRQYDFDAKDKEVQIIRKLTKQDIVDHYTTFFSPLSSSRKALFVNVVCPGHEKEDSAIEDGSKDIIHDLKKFRSSIELFPEATDVLL
eukprot:g572.t1